MKKIIAKLTGMMKYFKYLGKLVQSLKILTNIIPSIILLVPEENRGSLNSLVDTLNNITEAIEKAEKFLNKFGIDTSIEEDEPVVKGSKAELEANIKKLEKVSRGFVRITEHHR